LPGAELWVVGQVHDEVVPLLKPYRDNPTIRFVGHAREGAEQWYSQSTVFVLPSIVEGSAKTTYEAMAAGLPVITTPNAGSVVRDGVDGFIVPIRSPEAIRDKLLFLFNNRDAVHEMGKSARNRIASFSWKTYEQRICTLYRELMNSGYAG
jgi:glycosyltransferase involved in cell wall biosynthesis